MDLNNQALNTLFSYIIDRYTKTQQYSLSRLSKEQKRIITYCFPKQVIELIYYYGIKYKKPLSIFNEDLLLPIKLHILSINIEQNLIILNIKEGKVQLLEKNKEYTFSFSGHNSINIFNSFILQSKNGKIHITIPLSIHQTGFRQSERISVGSGKMLLHFHHPRLPGVKLTKSVIDISGFGLSFPFDPKNDLLFPGEKIEKILLELPKFNIQANAIIRSIRTSKGLTSCGIEILGFPNRKHAEHWGEFVFHYSHPRLQLGQKRMVEDAWLSLSSSGYLDYINPKLYDYLKNKFIVSWQTQAVNTHLSRFFVYYDKTKKPIGTMAVNILYPGTWLVHNMGIDKEKRKGKKNQKNIIARDIYKGIIFLLNHLNKTDYFVLYVESNKPWTINLYAEFLKNYANHDDFIYDRYHVFKCTSLKETSKMLKCQKVNGIEVVEQTSELLEILQNYLKKELPKIEFEAFCYGESLITFKKFSKECDLYNYERHRIIYFALQNNIPKAALVVESGPDGMNLYSLFNRCWFFFLEPDAAEDKYIIVQLINQALLFYNKISQKEFMLLINTDKNRKSMFEKLGFDYKLDVMRWLSSCSILPAYLNYIEEYLGKENV